LAGPLAEVRRAQGRIRGKLESIGFDLGQQHEVLMVVRDAVTTSAIEGEQIDPSAVRSSVARRMGMDTVGLPPPSRPVDGLVQMLLDAKENHSKPLTAERLQGWQAALFPTGFSGIRRIPVGEWRSGEGPMQVVSGRPDREVVHFEAPPAERVGEEIELFLNWWGSGTDPDDGVLRAALAHLWFVTIHPFEDGNGRVARAIADMALAKDERSARRLYSISAQIQADRDDYYESLKQAQQGDGQITDWITWFCGCACRGIERSEGELEIVLAKSRFWQKHAAVPLNSRQTKVINRLADAGPGGFEGGLTRRKYVALTRTSRATAQREIADLVAKGVVVVMPGGGRSTSYELAW